MSDPGSLTSYADDNEETFTYQYVPTEKEKAAQQAFIAEVWKLYNSGTPLFTREMIKLAQKQISQHPVPENADLLGFDGKMHSMSLAHVRYCPDDPDASDDEGFVPDLHFNCIERLTQPSPDSPSCDMFLSVSIGGTQLRKDTKAPGLSQEMVNSEFAKNLNLWEKSENWKMLQASLAPYLSALSRTVKKIIGFGLGEVTTPSGPYSHPDLGRRRACAQHALMITLAKILERTQEDESPMEVQVQVKCYVQDPAYYDTCTGVLASHGVEVLEPQNGFLMVDDDSAVLSFSPNIPVHQLVADLARPVIMIWDKIEEPVKREWQLMEKGGGPYTTDPISPRVLAMASEYVELPLFENDDLFSSAAVYVRKG